MQDAVIVSLATISSALIGLCIRYAFKSKCSDVSLCGCLSVKRDTNLEATDNESEKHQEENQA